MNLALRFSDLAPVRAGGLPLSNPTRLFLLTTSYGIGMLGGAALRLLGI